MTKEEREKLIDRYAAGVEEVAQALENFPKEHLMAHPIPGKWSAAEIVHHLADSESISAIRIRMLIAEDHAIIHGYDQEEFARRLHYDEPNLRPSLEAFRGARNRTVPFLRKLTDEDWGRAGWHTESGSYTPETWLEIYAAHAHGHASQIRKLREALG